MKTRITRPRLVTVKVGEQSLELQAPGFKSIRRGDERQFYWIKDDHAEFALYEPKTVRIYVAGLDPEAAGERIQRICQREQEAMLAWADGNASDRERLGPKYDGTLKSVINLYMDDEESSFGSLKANTKQSYKEGLKIVDDTIGLRRLDRLHPKSFRRYYNNWRAPAEPGGEERVRRAYGCIQMVRAVLSYGIEADITEAAAAGASDDDIASTGAHDNKRTTRAIYKRQAREISERVQAARQASRTNN